MSADSPGGGAVSMGGASAQQAPPAPDPQPTASFEPPTATQPPSGTGSSPVTDKLPDGVAQLTEKPEAMVGAAFAGGLLFAIVLKRLGR